jgi:hypothetical protein
LHKGIKVVALVINKEIWEWPVLCLHPLDNSVRIVIF